MGRRLRVARRLLGVLVGTSSLVTSLLAPPALAGDLGGVRPRLDYNVATECPAQAAWLEALLARLPHRLRTQPLVALEVKIERQRDVKTGRVQYVGAVDSPGQGAHTGRRDVRGASCHEVAEALTLIAALSVEQQAESDGRHEQRSSWTLTREQELSLATEPAADVPARAENAARDPARPRLGALGYALLDSAAAPGLGMNLGAGVTLRWDTANFQPWLFLGVYAGSDQVELRGASASGRFGRISSQVVGCPWRFPLATALTLRPCLQADLGKLTGTGVGVDGAIEQSALWASVGLELRAQWSFWEFVDLGASLAGVLPLWRPRFYFLPEITVFEVAPVGLRAGAFANLSF